MATMNTLCFLPFPIPKEIENTVLEFLNDDAKTVKALKSISKISYNWIESGSFFSEADRKAHLAVRELAGVNFQLKNLSEFQIRTTAVLKTFPFTFIAKIARSIFPDINNPFELEKKRLEIACDFSVSHFFGTIEDFNALPLFTPETTDFTPEDMPNAIMRYKMPIKEPDWLTEKPALFIRGKYSHNGQSSIRGYIYNPIYMGWFFMGSFKNLDRILPTIYSIENLRLTDENGKPMHAYNQLKKLVVHKKLDSESGSTTFTIE